MKKMNQTEGQLMTELARLRGRIAEMKAWETELKRAEQAAEEAREYAENILATLHEPLVVLDADLRVISANRSFYQTFKVLPEETEGQLLYELGNQQWDIPQLRELLEEILPQNTKFDDFEVEHDFPAIGRRTMLLNARRIYGEDKKTNLLLLAINDVTERKEAERAVQEALEYAQSIVQTVREPLVVLDADLRVITANRSFYQTFKVIPEETEGQLLYDLGNQQWDIPKLRELLEEILPQNTEFDDFEVEHDFPAIGPGTMLVNARRIHRGAEKTRMILLAIEEITERKKMHERLMRQEKLAILGQLTGGVGHELRNPLGAIKNAAYFLNMALEKPEPEVKETLEILEKEVAASERIISSLLGFACQKPPIRRKVDVNQVIQEALCGPSLLENIEVVSQLDEGLPAILADSDQLRQAFGNIILNAIQAMPEGGRMTIRSECPSPGWVALSFTDTGEGIPEQNLDRLFEPLFTTRARGIGLGLALTKSWVEGHGGDIKAQTEMGKGATFTVRLPVTGEEKK